MKCDKNCCNYESDTECKALTEIDCTPECFARVTNPWAYLRLLKKIEFTSRGNNHLSTSRRKEIKAFIETHNLTEGVTLI